MDTLICIACGATNAESRSACRGCGAELGTTHTAPPSTVAMEPDQDDPPPPPPTD